MIKYDFKKPSDKNEWLDNWKSYLASFIIVWMVYKGLTNSPKTVVILGIIMQVYILDAHIRKDFFWQRIDTYEV